MAKSPIIVVWASTTSNKENLNTTRQGNGIVFESDIVSNFVNSALYINSQATRNLQVMGGYYDGGQEYKNYQFCSQLSFIGGEYVLNYYMATQDNPTLAPTDATSYQQGTTDMEIPTNGSSVQSGWKKINLVPNQGNIAYKDKQNTFTQNNTFNGDTTLENIVVNGNSTIGSNDADNCNIQATTTIPNLSDSTLKSGATLDTNNGVLKAGGVIFDKSKSSGSTSTIEVFLENNSITIQPSGSQYTPKDYGECSILVKGTRGDTAMLGSGVIMSNYDANAKIENNGQFLVIQGSDSRKTRNSTISLGVDMYSNVTGSYQKWNGLILSVSPNIPSFSDLTLAIGYVGLKPAMSFSTLTTISNAQFGVVTRGIDPVWEQDYATANYVNQKLQELFDYLDTRLTTIENKLGITSAKAKSRSGFDARAMINNIAVPKSKLAELLDRLDNLEGYEGVLGYSNDKERIELSKAIDNEEAIMQVMDSIKARMEKEAKEREAQDAQQNENPNPKTRKTKSKIKE